MATIESPNAGKSPAFQFYPKDFLTDENVVVMSLQERGAYITLLCLCWQQGTLPSDVDRLARLCGVPPTVFRRLWPALALCFRPAETSDRLVHPRLEKERQKQVDYRRRQSDASHKRWDARGISQTDAVDMPEASSPSSSSSSSADCSRKDISSEALTRSEPAALTFPIVGGKGETAWGLTDTKIAEWQALFPNADVPGECRKALAWVQANGERRKTGRGMTRFLVGWLTRTVDSRRSTSASAAISSRTLALVNADADFLARGGQ